MSNTQRYGGLKLVDGARGAGTGLEIVIVPAGDTHPTGIGDPLIQSAGNYTSIGVGPNVQQCVQGTATGIVYGVAMSAMPHYSDGTASMDLTKVYRPASTAMYVLI